MNGVTQTDVTDQRGASRHAAQRFAERRVFVLRLQLLQELWRQPDVHGQRHALADVLQESTQTARTLSQPRLKKDARANLMGNFGYDHRGVGVLTTATARTRLKRSPRCGRKPDLNVNPRTDCDDCFPHESKGFTASEKGLGGPGFRSPWRVSPVPAELTHAGSAGNILKTHSRELSHISRTQEDLGSFLSVRGDSSK